MLNIDIPMTVIAPFYYLSVAIAMVLVALYFSSDRDIPFGVWSIVISAVIVVILAFFDYAISYERARERIVRIEKNKRD